MKILVITFAAGLNPGTFMQSFGVRTGLLKIFPDAEIDYLKFPDFKWDKSRRDKNGSLWHLFLQKGFALYRLMKYKRLERRYFHFTREIDLFDYDEAEAKDLLSHYDLVVVGSDTILEAAKGGSKDQYGLNWYSSVLCNAPHILFAASASPAHYSSNKEIVDKLKDIAQKFKFIGLRDDLTVNLFKNVLAISEEKIFKQPDPSFLLDVQQFHLSNYYVRKLKGRKIAYYNFMSDFPYRKKLADILRQKGYTVVSSVYNPFADICIDTIDAKEWAGIFRHCDLIVTERFHDSVFSLRNCKPVIAVDWEDYRITSDGDSKTLRILKDYEMENYHFVLKEEQDLDRIVGSIDDLLRHFDKSKVAQMNEMYISRANNIDSILKNAL